MSDISAATHGEYAGVERICNQIAAEVLTPLDEFLHAWGTTPDLDSLTKVFKVSRLVVARRALDLGKISRDTYAAVVVASKHVANPEGGGNPYATIPVRSSKSFTAAVLSSAMGGRMMLRDAASLLNVKPATVVELASRRE